MSWSRRSVLLSLLGITAAAGGGLALVRSARTATEPEDLVVELLLRRLAHLEIDPPSLRTFASDHVARASPGELAELEGVAVASRPMTRLLERWRGGAAGTFAHRQLERRIVARFLLGSDALRGDRGSRATRFVAYPDPYELGGANPLAVRKAGREETTGAGDAA